MKLLLATNNKNKIKEIVNVLSKYNFDFVLPSEINCLIDPEETGSTFCENALIKARAFYEATNIASLADDSGLEVDALDKKPGVLSSRFFGDVTDLEKCMGILKLLGNLPFEKRSARFRACFILYENKIICQAEGVCEGHIGFEPKGENGFGYDPIFIPLGYEKSMAELSLEEKEKISHRGRALRELSENLKQILRK
ncbi:Nucleoside-triphosphatase rdgB [Thermodesulfobium narugense DSM 14796]|uniref:dITP/XTP pyrophosphatase n=1 Tax=Thermodesulfobium narugense DSM 14796 TaxID=747365 RepID=M1E911_9BACT|nr:RdgB/HAM1 family non-canonical purine NTP pyrophosphatase [Thermodesulfobium narugense]AEE14774.1 Nucleoside-triphosphatase rdgB [Thermodesulfobium narugense DSM 14796]